MSTIAASFPNIAGSQPAQDHYPLWTPMLNGDVGSSSKFGGCEWQTFQVYGTFGTGGSITIRGSNKPSPDPTVAADWFTLTDRQGVALTFTAAGGKASQELPLHISPIVTAGDVNTSLSVQGFGVRLH